MSGILTLISLIVCAVIIFAVPGIVAPWGAEYGISNIFDSGKAVLLCAVLAMLAGLFIARQSINDQMLLKIFIVSLLVRIVLGTLIFVFRGQEFFGGDAITYDYIGNAQVLAWAGDGYYSQAVRRFVGPTSAAGWGMVYLVAGIYVGIGRNMLAVQFVNAVFGATTAALIYYCALEVFDNIRVARISALAVAFYPSLALWSSQGLKDAPIVFFLALSILSTLRLNRKFSLKSIAFLVVSLFALLSLRFYVFYMITAAVVGSLIIGGGQLTSLKFVRQLAVIIMIGLALTYLGVMRYANVQLESYTSLERIHRSRLDASTRAQSGFSQSDVSTSEGALSTIPAGLLYLLFAPFPWQLASLRQSITLPEMIVWWASFPMLILGLWFSIKYRLREISPILIFTVMLSLAYSIVQGNVGNAYRQRSQLLIFYFIFIAVGYVLVLEKREKRKRRELDSEPISPRLVAPTWTRR